MNQKDFRLPATGEAWRHYKGGPDSLYTIVGLGHDPHGNIDVIYTPFGWSSPWLPPLHTNQINRFLQAIPVDADPITGKSRFMPRFKFERGVGADPHCPFIPLMKPEPK
jgi:hypothetical protein